MLMRRPFTDAGIPAEMTLAELEDQLGRLLKGKTSVHPLEVYRELTGLARMDGWAEVVTRDLIESFGLEEHGDGLFYPIPRMTEDHPPKGIWN